MEYTETTQQLEKIKETAMPQLSVSSYTTQITSLNDAKEETYTTTVTATPQQWANLADKLTTITEAHPETTLTLPMPNGQISITKENNFFAPDDHGYIFEDTDPSGDWAFILDENAVNELASEIFEVV